MATSDDAGYALSCWQRFNDHVEERLSRASICAFGLVACADGDLARTEVERCASLLNERASTLIGMSDKDLQRAFGDVVSALLADPTQIRRHALDVVGAIKDEAVSAEVVFDVAQIAARADGRQRASEDEMLDAISRALGL